MTDEGTSLGTDDAGRRPGRALLVAAAVVCLVLASGIAPAFGSVAGGTPIASLVPVFSPSATPSGGPSGSSGGLGGLGALNAGSQVSVGGDLASGDGGFRSLSAEVHFVVESSQPAYWRTNAYTTYTGTGWRVAEETHPYDPPVERRAAGTGVQYAVTLRQAATTLPTVWTPQTVETNTDLRVSGTAAVVATSRLPAGTTYTGTSVRPPDDPALLRSLGRSYPDGVGETYTQLPAASQRALGPFVDNLTANASNPYEVAKRVERWLEATKEYSLNVSQPPSEGIARQFVFEMETGYCEYFATAMTAMLRSQDIPARYVVGYSTGERTGANTYTVRALNAHAWVEVYFPDVGWVRFDPTPASERLTREEQALRNQTGSGYRTTTSTTTGPTTTAPPTGTTTGPTTDGSTTVTTGPTTTSTTTRTTTRTTTPPDDGNDTTDPPPDDSPDRTGPLSIELNRTPVPGAVVGVTVTRSERPVVNAVVSFNGERVGVTDANGTVVARVPYVRELVVDVRTTERTRTAGVGFSAAGTAANNSSATYDVATTASLTLVGSTVTGNEVLVVATVDGVPVRDAAVYLNGDQVARTNATGRATIRFPTDPGSATIRVERDPVNGSTTVALERLTMTVTPGTPLALPLGSATVSVSLNGTPATGVPVFLDGHRVGTTGPDGDLSVRLPLANAAYLRAVAYTQARSTTLDGLFLHAGLLGGGVLVLLGATAYGFRRYAVSPRGLLSWLVAAAIGVVRGAVNLLVAATARLVTAVRRALRSLAETVRGRLSPRDLAVRFAAWLAAVREDVERTGRSVRDRVTTGNGHAAEDEPAESYRTLRDAWRDFLAATSVRRPARHTPGELATHAVERDGLPADAVTTLRDAFRSVEYGHRDPDDRLGDVETAMTEIEAALADDEEDES